MKKSILLLISLCITMMLYATAPTTLSVVSTAGGLSTAITVAGGTIATVTNLTVTGTIDARDFKMMRDSMPVLAVVNLGAVNIAAYTGTGGTAGTGSTVYLDNVIPINAFYYKSSITSISLPITATSIGDSAFSGCYYLTSVTIYSSVISIGDNSFNYCDRLTTISIPSSVNSIRDNSFLYCTASIEVDAANLNYSSQSGVLFNKTKTTLLHCYTHPSYTIPSSVTTIGNYAFAGCDYLYSISIPSSVTTIGDYAFTNCCSLTSVTIPSSVTSIGEWAFSGGQYLNSVTILSLLTTISAHIFDNCHALSLVTIPTTVTTIGDGGLPNFVRIKS